MYHICIMKLKNFLYYNLLSLNFNKINCMDINLYNYHFSEAIYEKEPWEIIKDNNIYEKQISTETITKIFDFYNTDTESIKSISITLGNKNFIITKKKVNSEEFDPKSMDQASNLIHRFSLLIEYLEKDKDFFSKVKKGLNLQKSFLVNEKEIVIYKFSYITLISFFLFYSLVILFIYFIGKKVIEKIKKNKKNKTNSLTENNNNNLPIETSK
jgi:hypothetical protein